MQVLVGRDALQHLVGDRVVAGLAGVAVADAGRELLEGHVRDRVEEAQFVGVLLELVDATGGRQHRVVAVGHVDHPGLFEGDGIHTAGDDEVVAHHDAVAVLLGGPATDPVAPPGGVHREVVGDDAVVRGQVVLGEQVGDHRGLATSSSCDCSGS